MITIASIQRAVAREFDVSERVLRAPRPPAKTDENPWAVARVRQVAMALSYLLTDHSQFTIGQKFGGRDHTTVMHARREVEKRRKADPALHSAMRRLTLQLLQERFA